MTKQTLTETLGTWNTASQVFIFSGLVLFVVKVWKKLSDYIIDAVLMKYTASLKETIEEIVNSKTELFEKDLSKHKEDFEEFNKKYHGVIEKNEGVLNEALLTLKKHEKNDKL